jgi:hypothetical protein
MMFVTVLLPYSIFRFVCISRFVIFLIGCEIFCGSPTNSLPGFCLLPLHRKWTDAVHSHVASVSVPAPGKGPVTRCASFFRTELLLARRTRFLSEFNTSKRPSKSTTQLLPNLIIIFDHRSVDRPSPRSLSFLSFRCRSHFDVSHQSPLHKATAMAIAQLPFFFSAPSHLRAG